MNTAAAETESDGAEDLECWCCGSVYTEAGLIRLGRHPEVGVCAGCARFLHRQAVARLDASQPSLAGRLRGVVRTGHDGVVSRGWHRLRVAGPMLRWINRHLP